VSHHIAMTRPAPPLSKRILALLVALCLPANPSWADDQSVSSKAGGTRGATNGPLRIHPTNPRYFADRGGKVVFLTGSHTWGNLQDYTYASKPSPAPYPITGWRR